MQTASAPSKSTFLNSLKSTFSSNAQSVSSNLYSLTSSQLQTANKSDLINADKFTPIRNSLVNDSPLLPPIDIKLSEDEQLAILEEVLDEVEAASTQTSVPEQVTENIVTQPNQLPTLATQQVAENNMIATDQAALGQLAVSIDPNENSTLNPPTPVGSAQKESLLSTSVAEIHPGMTSTVEVEPQKELSPEIESFIEEVTDHQNQLPQEIVIADGNVSLSPMQYPAQPVIVIPMTEEKAIEAEKKGPEFSIKWLVKYCEKVIKMFHNVIYTNQVNN